MISPITASESKIIVKKANKFKVEFFSKSPSPFNNAKKGGTLNSFIVGATVTAGFFYLYKKYRRAKLAKGEALNPTIDNTAKSLNKKLNNAIYNVSKVFEEKGFKKFAKVMKVLIFKI